MPWTITELLIPTDDIFLYFQNYGNGRCISRDGAYVVGTCYTSGGVNSNGVFWHLPNLQGVTAQAPVNGSSNPAVNWTVTSSDETGANWTGWFEDPDTAKITPCVWIAQTPNRMQPGDYLSPNTINMGISADGTIGVGFVELVANANTAQAAWWTNGLSASYHTLTHVASGTPSSCSGIADDNNTICGVDIQGGIVVAAKWSIAGNTETILNIPAGSLQTVAEAISADASVIVGANVDASGNRIAGYWAGGAFVPLPFAAGSDGTVSEAHGISLDNTVICGNCTDGSGLYMPVVWNSGVISVLPLLPAATEGAVAGITDNGFLGVGYCIRGGLTVPVIWTFIPGPQPSAAAVNERISGRITGIYLNAEPQPVRGLFKSSTNNRVNLLPDLLQTDPTLNPGLT